ncbi:hypothetical protein MKW94_013413 [Papaver nudicaule]|uniref:SHSP domain-containing protein n=1 Tax=Papaver nudicaule TaxID=74823 RepID=A0AA41S0A0_PAPNU|nr:hypothetical protein [Papaver nudicaule]
MASLISCLSAVKPPSTPHVLPNIVLSTNNFCPPKLVSYPKSNRVATTPMVKYSSFLQTQLKHKKDSRICSVSSPSHTEISPLCFSLADLLDAIDMETESDYDSSSEEEEVEEEQKLMKRWICKELEQGVELKICMPGLGKEDVKVTLEGTTLFIKGKAENEKPVAVNDLNSITDEENDLMNIMCLELDLDFLKLNEMKAEMKNGVLKIFIPKVVEEKVVMEVQVE